MGYFDSLPAVGTSSPAPVTSTGGTGYFDALPAITEKAPLTTASFKAGEGAPLIPEKITPPDTTSLFPKTASMLNGISVPKTANSSFSGLEDKPIKADNFTAPITTISQAPKQSLLDKVIAPVKDALFGEDQRVAPIHETIVSNGLLSIGKQLGIDKQIPIDATSPDAGVAQARHDKAVADYVRANYEAIQKENPSLPAHPDMLSPAFKDINDNIDAFANKAGIDLKPNDRELLTKAVMLPVTGAFLVSDPLAFAGWSAFSKAEQKLFGGSIADRVADKFGLSNGAKDALNLVEMFAVGGLLHKASIESPKIAAKWTKDITTTYMPGKTIRFEPAQIHSALSGGVERSEISPEEFSFINSVVGKGGAAAWKDAIKNGTTINIPPEKVIMIADKPYWAKIKGTLGISTDPTVISQQEAPSQGAEGRASRLLGSGSNTLSKIADTLDGETASHIDSHGSLATGQALRDNLKISHDDAMNAVSRNNLKNPEDILNPRRGDGTLELVNPKQATKLSKEDAFPVGEKVADLYWKDKVAADEKAGKTVVIGTDDIKDHFGNDYNNNNHLIYSRAASVTFQRALKEGKQKDVIFTGGGPASGKSELIVNNIKDTNHDAIVMDSTMANYENVKKQIEMAREAGKNVEIHGIIPDINTSKKFSLQRGDEIGRSVPDNEFSRGHAGFPATLLKLLEEGVVKSDDVHLLDTRDVRTKEKFKEFIKNSEYVKNPIDFLRTLEYNEDNITKTYGTKNYTKEGLQYIHESEIRKEPSGSPSQDRTNEGENERQGDTGNEIVTKTRGLSLGVQEKAIENKLTDSFGDLPEYQTVNMKDQASQAQKLIADDYDKARRIAMGQELPPEGLLPESVFVAVENKAIKDGDIATLRDLATSSSLASEATVMGQRIRTLAERNPESAVSGIRAVAQAREKAALKKVKNIGKEKKSIAKAIKSDILKKTPSKQTWGDFIASIQC